LKTIAYDFRDSGDGSLFFLSLGVPESGRQGLFKIIAAETKDSQPPPFVPASAVKFQRWRLDGQKAWAALEKMAGDISPQVLAMWNFMINSANTAVQEKDPTYDLKKNLVANLGNDLISYEKAPRGNTPAELESPPSILLIGSPDAGQLAAALKGPLNLLPQSVPAEEREFLGRKICTVTLSSLPRSASPNTARRKLSYAASGGYLALSMDASILEEFLRGSDNQAKALRETPGLAEAAQKIGGTSTGLFGFENQNAGMRLVFESLKRETGGATNNPSSANPLPGGIPFLSPEKNLTAWMDFTLLPAYDKVAKYFSYTVYSGSVNGDGLTFKLFSPVPPQLKK
jgi:hypothetical protein